MTTIDRKPPDPPSLIEVAAMLAREGKGSAAQAVKKAHEQIAALRKALFGGESGGAVDLSIAAHVAILRATGGEHEARWATERFSWIEKARDL